MQSSCHCNSLPLRVSSPPPCLGSRSSATPEGDHPVLTRASGPCSEGPRCHPMERVHGDRQGEGGAAQAVNITLSVVCDFIDLLVYCAECVMLRRVL